MPRKKKEESVAWPKVTKGSHLTVYTHENGKTTLEWDNEALSRDVQAALDSVTEVKPKATRKKKVKEN